MPKDFPQFAVQYHFLLVDLLAKRSPSEEVLDCVLGPGPLAGAGAGGL